MFLMFLIYFLTQKCISTQYWQNMENYAKYSFKQLQPLSYSYTNLKFCFYKLKFSEENYFA